MCELIECLSWFVEGSLLAQRFAVWWLGRGM